MVEHHHTIAEVEGVFIDEITDFTYEDYHALREFVGRIQDRHAYEPQEVIASNVPGMAPIRVVAGALGGGHFVGFALPENLHLLDAPVHNKLGVQMPGLVPRSR